MLAFLLSLQLYSSAGGAGWYTVHTTYNGDDVTVKATKPGNRCKVGPNDGLAGWVRDGEVRADD